MDGFMSYLKKTGVYILVALGLVAGAGGFPMKKDKAYGASVGTDLSLSVVSSYVFRGITINKGPAVQPNVELSAMNAKFGLWGSYSLDQQDDETNQEIEVYLRYGIPVGFAELTLGVWEYIYPEDKDIDNDREIELTAEMGLPLQPRLSVFLGLDGSVENNKYYELAVNQDLLELSQISLSLGATAGYIDAADEGQDGFSHGMLSLGASYEVIDASFNWVLETDDKVNDLEGQKDFYVQVSSGFSF